MATQYDSLMTLLKSKLKMPDLHPLFISRRHLLSKMDNILKYKVNIITSPAGSGKTSIVREWLEECSVQFSWLTLDSLDNEPLIFWSYIILSLSKTIQGMERKVFEFINEPLKPSWDVIVTLLINDIIEHNKKIVLVLDDCHNIKSKEIFESLSFFLVNLPHNLHICLISRMGLKFPVGKLRSTEQLYEVGYKDIRFNETETRKLINKTINFPISEASIKQICHFTDGWVTGIHLLSLLLKQQTCNSSPINISILCNGNHHFFADYFSDEVFNKLSRSRQLFLMQTSILESFNRSLFIFVTNDAKSSNFFMELLKSNIYILPVDGETHWYRYTHAFRDFLVDRLEIECSYTIPFLHSLASQWYDENNLPKESNYHRLKVIKNKTATQLSDHGLKLPTPLTYRELEIIKLVAAGLSNKEISRSLFISNGTVKIHLNRIYSKLNVSNRIQAITKAKELKLL